MSQPANVGRFRALALLYGVAVFFWLQVEDNAVQPVVAFGFAGAILTALYYGTSWLRWARRSSLRFFVTATGTGIFTGAGTSLAAAALMVLKTGLHSHAFPDYPPAQLLAILERLPLWALAGGLAGLGIGLAWMTLGNYTVINLDHREHEGPDGKD